MEGVRLYDGHAEGLAGHEAQTDQDSGRGSRAMVCSEKELGLSDEHEDIIYLPDDAPVGMPLADYMGDAVLEFDIKGPFGHLQSVFGVAREVAALFDLPLKRDALEVLERHPAELTPDAGFPGRWRSPTPICARATRPLSSRASKVAPSPFWMQHAVAPRRHAPHQQHRGHHQLCDAGAGPAAARLRLPRSARQTGRGQPGHHRAPRRTTASR